MFKNAATKIAHNSTIPSIGGNKDLRPLQDLITAEKSVLISLRRLSLDFTKASEALRGWGMGEGDDLGDTLSASTVILALFADALLQYATHEQSVRDHMKAIRSREEGLDELRRRRKNISAKADSAEKRLNKMSPEHKQLAVQTDLLHRLRDEIRQLDTEIMTEEARLGDFKRSTTRSLMGLKFGGLLELSAKGTIVGDFGKQIIAEIPEDVTPPGLPRNFYNGHGKTESCVGEAERSVGEVLFSGITNRADPPSFRPPDFPPGPNLMPTGPMNPGDTSPSGSNSYSRFDPYNDNSMHNTNISQPGMSGQSSPIQVFPSNPHQSYTYDRNVDEFGAGSSSSAPLSPRLGAGPGGGKFATFPVKAVNRPGPNFRDDTTPSLNPHINRAPSLSFSSQVEQALVDSPTTSGLNPPKRGGNGFDDPVPVYEAVPSPTYPTPPGPPPGAAAEPPLTHLDGAMVNPWSEEPETEDNHNDHGEHETPPGTSGDEAGDVHLAYASSTSDNSHLVPNRRVRFGAVNDVDQEMEERRRQSEDESGHDDLSTITSMDGPDEARTPTVVDLVPTPSPPSDQRPRRVPVPAVDDLTDESSLNAAAAREVSREMDALTFNPPPVDRGNSPLLPPSPLFAQNPAAVRTNLNIDSPVPITGPSVPDKTSTSTTNSADKATSPLQIPLQHTVPPPHINLPDRSVSSFSSSNTGSPYRTPLESPFRTPSESPLRSSALGITSPGTSPTIKTSSSSLSSPPLPPGTRTISAAAFKRPSPRMSVDISTPIGSVGPADTTPLTFKKRALPSSPYPQRLQPQPASHEPSITNLRGNAAPAPAPLPSQPAVHRPIPSTAPQNTSSDDDYDQFDYITAYVNTMGPEPDDGSPVQADYGRLGPSKVVNGPGAGESSMSSSGYGQGRFATSLDSEGLR